MVIHLVFGGWVQYDLQSKLQLLEPFPGLGQHPPAGSKIFCGPPRKYYQTPTHGEVRISVRGNHPWRCALSLFSYAFGIEKNVDGWHLIWISNPFSNQFHVQTASPLSITRNLHFRSSSYSALTRSHSCFLQSFRHRNERTSVIVVHDIPASRFLGQWRRRIDLIYIRIYIYTTFACVPWSTNTSTRKQAPPKRLGLPGKGSQTQQKNTENNLGI